MALASLLAAPATFVAAGRARSSQVKLTWGRWATGIAQPCAERILATHGMLGTQEPCQAGKMAACLDGRPTAMNRATPSPTANKECRDMRDYNVFKDNVLSALERGGGRCGNC